MSINPKRTSVTLKLPQLQNLIKRDPAGYREEFEQQKRHFESELEIFKLRPTADSERFTDLVGFMAAVAFSFAKEEGGIAFTLPISLMELLETCGSQLHPDVRAKLLWAVIHLRSKNLIEPIVLLKLAFRLLAIPDKAMRTSIQEYIFSDIKAINLNKHNDKLNKRVQALLFALVEEDTSVIARKTVSILTELYRRRVWTDARTVNVLATACCSSSIQVAIPAVNFFLGIETKMMEDDAEEQKIDHKKGEDIDRQHKHSKTTKKRIKQSERAHEALEKHKRDLENKAANAIPVFPAIQLINDPQGLAEKLFTRARGTGERFEVKLLLMNFVSRLIGCHKLIVLTFYSYLQRYLTSHQIEVTRILSYLVQGCHEFVPPEELVPVLKTIAHNFITERCTNEQMAVGLNAVREVVQRVPSMLREEGMGDLVQDLAMYGRRQHKSVMIAAHSLINLVRHLYPTLLKTKDRGKFYNPEAIPGSYGAVKTSSGVDGADLLEQFESGDIRINSDDELVWKEDQSEEVEEDEGGWDSVSEDGDEAPDLVEVNSAGENEEEEEEDDDEEGWEDVASEEETDEKKEAKATGGAKESEEDDDDDEEEGWESVEEGDEDSSDSDDNGEEEEEEEDEEGSEGEWEMMPSDDAKKGKKDAKRKQVSISEPESATATKKQKIESGNAVVTATAEAVAVAVPIKKTQKERIDANRILTDSDFDLIRRLKAAQSERMSDPRYRTKKAQMLRAGIAASQVAEANNIAAAGGVSSTGSGISNISSIGGEMSGGVEVWPEQDSDGEDVHPAYAVDPQSLGAGMKTSKTSKLERIAVVVGSRKESKWEHGGHAGGLTNKEKERTKNFVMVRKGKVSVKGKVNKSNSTARWEKMHHKDSETSRDKRKRRRL